MKLKAVFLLIIIFLEYPVHSQTGFVPFDLVKPGIHLYVIGESHAEKNTELQFEIVKHLQKQAQLKTIIMEVPVEVGKVLNDIVLTGGSKSVIDDLFRYFPHRAKKNVESLLDSVIDLNRKLPQEEKIGIKGIDLVYYPDHHFIISTLRIVFPELKDCTIPIVQKELFSKKKPKLKKEQSLIVLKQLLEDVSNNKDLYRKCLGARMENYQSTLYNTVHYKELPKWDSQDAFREEILSRNLISTIDTNIVSLMICGYSHLARHENDMELLWEHSFKSMIANANIMYSKHIFTIVTQYYRQKWILRVIFGETNLLNDPMETYIDKKKTKYQLFTGEELKKHPKAFSRCDMVIIQNKKYKKQKKKDS